MKALLLPLAVCAALGGCYSYAPYGYGYPYQGPNAYYAQGATVPKTGAPNTTVPSPNAEVQPNVGGQVPEAGTVDPNAQVLTAPQYSYAYPSAYPYAYPYASPYYYGYPYASPYYYGGYGYSPLWISGAWYFGGGGHGGHGHGGHGHGGHGHGGHGHGGGRR
jgi:hypothetical protein